MNRRRCLALLTALPFIGRLMPTLASTQPLGDFTADTVVRIFRVPPHLLVGTSANDRFRVLLEDWFTLVFKGEIPIDRVNLNMADAFAEIGATPPRDVAHWVLLSAGSPNMDNLQPDAHHAE